MLKTEIRSAEFMRVVHGQMEARTSANLELSTIAAGPAAGTYIFSGAANAEGG